MTGVIACGVVFVEEVVLSQLVVSDGMVKPVGDGVVDIKLQLRMFGSMDVQA